MAENTSAALDLPASGTQRGTVIWLHGLGADGHDFEPLIPELGLRERGLRVLLPHAPVQPVTINGGMPMRAWYDIYDMSLARIDAAGIRASVARVQALVAAEIAAGIPSRNILLAGFSQGGVIALQAALSYPAPLGGVLALSTYVALPEALSEERHPANARLPVLIAHGLQDSVVPVGLAHRAEALLRGFGNPVEVHLYPMGHGLCPEQIGHLRDWFRARIDGMEPA